MWQVPVSYTHLTFTVKGKVKEIYTNVDITVKDSGTVEKTSGSGTVNGISVTGVKLNKAELSLEKGKTETLTATIEPSTATNKSVTWESSNTAVATVDQSGKAVSYTHLDVYKRQTLLCISSSEMTHTYTQNR